MRGRHDVHVAPRRGSDGWQVTKGGRTLSHHVLQSTAVQVARRAARRDHVELVTHSRRGRIRAKDSYGREARRRDYEE